MRAAARRSRERHGPERGPRLYADMPVRAKLLVPFAILMVIWGGFGTYVLTRGAAGEARGRATARLAEALDGARAAFSDVETGILETVRLGARTEGVAEAISAADERALRRLLLPVALNADHDDLWVVDSMGAVLLRVSLTGGAPTAGSGGRLTLAAVDRAARGVTDRRGDKHVQVTDRSFVIAGPVRDAADRSVGALVVSDRLSRILARMGRGTQARVVLFAPDGTMLGSSDGQSLPYRDATTGIRASVPVGDEPYEALYAPVEARSERIGILSVALPARIALAGVSGQAAMLAILVGFVVVAAVVIGLLTAHAITKPIGSLLDATRALERGDLSARARLRSRDEVGTLAASFDRMAGQLQASHSELERKVAERTTELERVNAELARASAAKSAFLAAMSHELRTPLHAIIGFADMLSDPSFGRPDARSTRELAGNIASSGTHLLTLINDALDLAKIEAGRIDIAPQPMSLARVAAEVDAQLTPLARAKRLALALEFDADLPRVHADPARVRQVLINLVANAIKFTPDGGRVAISGRRDGAEVTVGVTDTGPGITKAETERIFKPYERGRASRGSEGAGLGLALARHLVELQGGRLWATGTPGKGSTFSFTLPVAPGARRAVLTPAARPAGREEA